MLEKGMRALVTGGSGGLGSAMVRMLARHGVYTIALSNDQAKLDALKGVPEVEIKTPADLDAAVELISAAAA